MGFMRSRIGFRDEQTHRKTEKERQFADRGGGGRAHRKTENSLLVAALEPNHTIARKLGPLEIIQSSLHVTFSVEQGLRVSVKFSWC
jgi:hypothetical protein